MKKVQEDWKEEMLQVGVLTRFLKKRAWVT